MRAVEFKSRIKDNQIQIPQNIHSELNIDKEREVKVILLIDESKFDDEALFLHTTQDQFFKGYADTDSIYDQE